jgi:ERCC4-type nuclease
MGYAIKQCLADIILERENNSFMNIEHIGESKAKTLAAYFRTPFKDSASAP